MNQSIVESIKDYIKQNGTNYALVLNGTWGSGKTYFWKKYLMDEIKEISNTDNQKYEPIYISLYGLANIMDIQNKLLLNLCLNKNKMKIFDNSKVVKWGSAVLSGLKDLEFMGMSAKSFDTTEIDIQDIMALNKIVFCFDDLERSSIDISDVLGYINKLVEHGEAKVIIIANEDEMTDLETYNKIKEKVIGRTLSYSPNHTEIVKLLIGTVENEECRRVLSDNANLIDEVFLSSSTNNIRILKQIIMDFEMIYSKVQESYDDLNEQIITNVLHFTLVIGFEIRSGAKGNDILESITSDLEFSENIHLKEEVRREYLKSLKSKYATANRKLYFLKFIEIFIRKGIFDLQLFEYEINEMIESINNNDMECSLFINSEYWNYSDDEFKRLSALTYEKILKGEINVYNYYAAYKCYEKLINHKLINITTDKLKNDILAGLEKAKTITRINDKRDVAFTLGIKGGDNETHKLIVHRTNSIINEWKLKIERKNIIELFNLVKEDINKFVDIVKTDKLNVPMFNLLDDELFINTILELENRNLYFYNGLLKTRYVMPIKKELEPELKILKSLRIGIEENLKEKPVTPNSILLRELSDFIDSLK
ncbi:P-loop NTPase fold protein [Bacillus thuringiensis]|nr:P-loop NTPase fold protein [Bacillus thuringiensis]